MPSADSPSRTPKVLGADVELGNFFLGIERLDTVMGPSLGGMVVLAYAAMFPKAARRLVCISGTMAAAPFAIALRSIQREVITKDPDWKGGDYPTDRPPITGRPSQALCYPSAAMAKRTRYPSRTKARPAAKRVTRPEADAASANLLLN